MNHILVSSSTLVDNGNEICQKNIINLNLTEDFKDSNCQNLDTIKSKLLHKSSKLKDNISEDEDGGARILILHPIYAGSHELGIRRIGEFLSKKGHSVTQLRWNYEGAEKVNSSVDVITANLNNSEKK